MLHVNLLMTQIWAFRPSGLFSTDPMVTCFFFVFFFRCLYYQFCSCWGPCFSVVARMPASPAPPLRCWKWLHVSHTNWNISSLSSSSQTHSIYTVNISFSWCILCNWTSYGCCASQICASKTLILLDRASMFHLQRHPASNRQWQTSALHVELAPYIFPTPLLFSVFLFIISASSPVWGTSDLSQDDGLQLCLQPPTRLLLCSQWYVQSRRGDFHKD